jgi:hypothetical protein
MVASKGARKALAGALSQVVLSRETILVHAESVLERADLVEGSLHSAAFNLWFAVLQRAEAEGAVERLVASVLEDNPGADSVRQALRQWQLAAASEAAPGRSLAPVDRAPASSPAPDPGLRSERARWLALGAVGVGFAVLFGARALREPAGPAPPPRRAAEPASPVQVGAALRGRTLTSAEADADAGDTLQREPAGSGTGVQKKGR